MAYGLNLFNANGDTVVEFKSTLYAKSTGNTRLITAIRTEANAIATAAGYPASAKDLISSFYSDQFTTNSGLPQVQVAEQDAWAGNLNGCRILGPTLNLNLGDTVFYKINTTGILGQLQVYCDLPGGYPVDKGVGVVVTEGDAAIPYIVASTTAGTASGENYGLVLNDAAGNTVFDSRKPLFSVFYSTVISKTVFDGVLNTGTPATITLPKAISGAYFSTPSLVAFKTYIGNAAEADFRVVLKQTSNTTLTISRVNVLGYNTSAPYRMWTQDTPLFVGRPL